MMRQLLAACVGFCLLSSLPALEARATEIPLRKAGLWEMKLVRTGSPFPEMTMQHCTDATTDRDMSTASSPLSKEICSKRDIQQTATGYAIDSVCSVASVSAGLPRDATTTIEAKWLGECKPGQKPGDIVMPGGFKLNVKDAEKLKGLVPK